MIQQRFYEHSGRFSPIGLSIALGIGIILAIGIAFIYNILIVIIPFVYINFFITLGFGFILGHSIRYLSRLGKVRSQRIELYLAGGVGFVGYYFQWVAYFVFLSYDDLSFEAYQSHFSMIYDPPYLFDLIIQLNEYGSWSMFGVPFNGAILSFVWILEALLIIGMPLLIIYRTPIVPYSELLEKWYTKYLLNYQFERIATVKQFKEDLTFDVESAIDKLSYGESNRYSEVSIFYLADEEEHFISVDNIYIEDQGKGKKSVTPIVHLFKIDTKTASSLMEKHGKKKQMVLNY